MKQKSLLYSLLFLLTSSIVVAAPLSLSLMFNPFGSIDLAGLYLRYYAFIDAVLYLILFVSIAQMVFQKVYKNQAAYLSTSPTNKEAKMVAVAVGLALTISMAVLEMNTGFNLGKLFPIGAVILLVALALLLYNMLLGLFPGTDGKSAIAAALTYLVIYGLLIVPFGALNRWIQQNVPLLAALLNIAALICFISLILAMLGLFSGSGSSTGPPGPQGPPGQAGPPGEKGPPWKDPEDKKPPEEPKKPVLTPSVRIWEPPKNTVKNYKPTDRIPFIFKTENVPKPFKYILTLISKSGHKENLYLGKSGYDNVSLDNLKNIGSKFAFPANDGYRIILQILDDSENIITDPKTGNEVIDYVDISVIGDKTPPVPPKPTGPNTLTITNPVNGSVHEPGVNIPITFDVSGPDHGKDVKFGARIIIKHKDQVKEIKKEDYTFDQLKNSCIEPVLSTLPEGDYEILIITFNSTKYLQKAKTTFKIEKKSTKKPRKPRKKQQFSAEDMEILKRIRLKVSNNTNTNYNEFIRMIKGLQDNENIVKDNLERTIAKGGFTDANLQAMQGRIETAKNNILFTNRILSSSTMSLFEDIATSNEVLKILAAMHNDPNTSKIGGMCLSKFGEFYFHTILFKILTGDEDPIKILKVLEATDTRLQGIISYMVSSEDDRNKVIVLKNSIMSTLRKIVTA